MDDLISRQAAIDLLKQMRKDGDMIPWEGKDVFARIRKLPPADVVPVRLGEWLDGYKMQTCSLCKCRGKKSWTFCPHCGARMIYGDRKKDKS